MDGARILKLKFRRQNMEQRWIPVSERLPEKYGSYLVAWKPCNMSEEYVVKKSGAPHYYEILEYDPDDESGWIESIEQATGEYEILAWMPLPDPYQESEEAEAKLKGVEEKESKDVSAWKNHIMNRFMREK
jgi:hypothetical protein